MNAYHCSHRGKKDAACKVSVSKAFLESAGTLYLPLAEVYNTVINMGKSEKLILPNFCRYSQQGIIQETLWMQFWAPQYPIQLQRS